MSNFSFPIDGSIIGVYLIATMVAGLAVRKYVGKVEHFLVAGREMNVYLGIASLAATEFGIVTCMYTAEGGFKYGFAGATPGIIMALAMFIVGYTGFCVKPLRDSGVMTIPELFEKRFGSRIRWLAGVVIVLGGLLNMGVFLRVGGQFLVVCCGLNLQYLEIAMTVLLVGVAVYTIMGGMLSVLVTDYLQFVVMSVGLLAVSFLIMKNVGWENIVGAAKPAGTKTMTLRAPRVALYKSWTAQMDEGWTRFLFEQFEFPHQTVHDAELRAGELNRNYDVLVMPSMDTESIVGGYKIGRVPLQYAGGITEAEYRALPQRFNPVKFDPKAWVRLARAAHHTARSRLRLRRAPGTFLACPRRPHASAAGLPDRRGPRTRPACGYAHSP
jgi:hypothetical protein